jgi:carbonic anhydrase
VSAIDDLLRNAAAYAEGFDKGDLPAPPAKRIAVLACMDARLAPMRTSGLSEGDAHVIRNAGGVVSDDAIRSLAISQNLMGTEEVVVIQHTDCGLMKPSDDHLRRRLMEAVGEEPGFPLHTFSDLEQSVRDSVQRIKDSPFVPNTDSVRGFVYEVETGKLREVT